METASAALKKAEDARKEVEEHINILKPRNEVSSAIKEKSLVIDEHLDHKTEVIKEFKTNSVVIEDQFSHKIDFKGEHELKAPRTPVETSDKVLDELKDRHKTAV